MGIHSFHLATVPTLVAGRVLLGGGAPSGPVPGLEHVEHLSLMTLGAPAVSLERLQLRRLAVFAQWECEQALDDHLAGDRLGRHLADGWHVRLELVRRWGVVTGLDRLRPQAEAMDLDEPVVAVTLAHLRLSELRRFFRWGRPVERQVRDDPGATLALAAVRPPGTFSTFSVWRSVRAMREMVEGRGDDSATGRHVDAMAEREREDFHHEFTTLRFRPLSEHGSWEGRSGIVPGL